MWIDNLDLGGCDAALDRQAVLLDCGDMLEIDRAARVIAAVEKRRLILIGQEAT